MLPNFQHIQCELQSACYCEIRTYPVKFIAFKSTIGCTIQLNYEYLTSINSSSGAKPCSLGSHVVKSASVSSSLSNLASDGPDLGDINRKKYINPTIKLTHIQYTSYIVKLFEAWTIIIGKKNWHFHFYGSYADNYYPRLIIIENPTIQASEARLKFLTSTIVLWNTKAMNLRE